MIYGLSPTNNKWDTLGFRVKLISLWWRPPLQILVAKMAQGLADDLASTLLLATNKPVLIAPAMNVEMWEHAATQVQT